MIIYEFDRLAAAVSFSFVCVLCTRGCQYNCKPFINTTSVFLHSLKNTHSKVTWPWFSVRHNFSWTIRNEMRLCVRANVVNNRRKTKNRFEWCRLSQRLFSLYSLTPLHSHSIEEEEKKNQWNHHSLCLGKCGTRQSDNPLNLCTMMHAANSVLHLPSTQIVFNLTHSSFFLHK